LVRQREYALILAEPHGLVVHKQRDDRYVRPARNLERGSPESVQATLGRARALREDQHAKPLLEPAAGSFDHMPGIERVRRPLEQPCTIQQRPPPAATIQDRLHGGGDVSQGRHQGRDIEKPGMVGHDHHGPGRQLTQGAARVEVQQV
jgi:hypothetical protein